MRMRWCGSRPTGSSAAERTRRQYRWRGRRDRPVRPRLRLSCDRHLQPRSGARHHLVRQPHRPVLRLARAVPSPDRLVRQPSVSRAGGRAHSEQTRGQAADPHPRRDPRGRMSHPATDTGHAAVAQRGMERADLPVGARLLAVERGAGGRSGGRDPGTPHRLQALIGIDGHTASPVRPVGTAASCVSTMLRVGKIDGRQQRTGVTTTR